MKTPLLQVALSILLTVPLAAAGQDAQRQSLVAKRSVDVMPFSLEATTHVFTKTADGGIQRVVAKDAADTQQISLVREHLHAIQAQFLKGDFAGPAHIHGMEMPGLAELKAARPGQVAVGYKDTNAGAELSYRTSDARLVRAIHRWFDAQLSDHGPDATAGDPHHDHETMTKD